MVDTMTTVYKALSTEKQTDVYMQAVGQQAFISSNIDFCQGSFGMCSDTYGNPWWNEWNAEQRDVYFFYRHDTDNDDWKYYCTYSMNAYEYEFGNTIDELLVLIDQPPPTPSPTMSPPTYAPPTPSPTMSLPTNAPPTPSPTMSLPTNAPPTPSPTMSLPTNAPPTPSPTMSPPTNAPPTPSPTMSPPTNAPNQSTVMDNNDTPTETSDKATPTNNDTAELSTSPSVSPTTSSNPTATPSSTSTMTSCRCTVFVVLAGVVATASVMP